MDPTTSPGKNSLYSQVSIGIPKSQVNQGFPVVAIALYGSPRHNANQKFNVGTGSGVDGVCKSACIFAHSPCANKPCLLSRSWPGHPRTSPSCRHGGIGFRTTVRVETLPVTLAKTLARTAATSKAAMLQSQRNGSNQSSVLDSWPIWSKVCIFGCSRTGAVMVYAKDL